jgi:hypothetical protein
MGWVIILLELGDIMGETKNYWISKFCLTRGIYQVEAKATSTKLIAVSPREKYLKPHWHNTKQEACKQALKMLTLKRKSLARQVKKLDELESEFINGANTED